MSEQELAMHIRKYPWVDVPWNDEQFYNRPLISIEDNDDIVSQPFSEDFIRVWIHCVDMKHVSKYIHWYSQDFLDELLYKHKINLLDLILSK